MLRFYFSALVMIGLFGGGLVSKSANAQTDGQLIEDPERKYSVTIPNKDWQAIEIKDGLQRTQIEIVYKVREESYLKVRRIEVEKTMKLPEIVKRDESQTITFLPGYTRGAIEDFSVEGGKIPAMLAAYDFTQGGRPKMGRNYYLRVNDTTVYVLRFAGNRSTMGALRSQTDNIARSFKAK